MKRLQLTEYEARFLPVDQLSFEAGEAIFRRWGSKVTVEFPSPVTANRWRITSKGWVGFFPVTPDFGLDIRPKVPIANLLRMFEYAYGLRSVEFHQELAGCATIGDFYSKLAQILSTRVLRRARRGLHRGYVAASETLPAVRGRVDVRRHMAAPWSMGIPCDFEEHTADLAENQILAWTLGRIAQSSLLAPTARRQVNAALRVLRGVTTERPFSAQDCVGRLYDRLNGDYEPLHLLCRFFLEHTGPTLIDGAARTVPFIVNMARLFELFLAEWLRVYLRANAPRYTVRWQDHVTIGEHAQLHFNIDIVLRDTIQSLDVAVIDAKYKVADRPSPDDVNQVAFYAQLRNCPDAILVYPSALPRPFIARMTHHRIRTLGFGLEGDLELAGRRFVAMLMESPTSSVSPQPSMS